MRHRLWFQLAGLLSFTVVRGDSGYWQQNEDDSSFNTLGENGMFVDGIAAYSRSQNQLFLYGGDNNFDDSYPGLSFNLTQEGFGHPLRLWVASNLSSSSSDRRIPIQGASDYDRFSSEEGYPLARLSIDEEESTMELVLDLVSLRSWGGLVSMGSSTNLTITDIDDIYLESDDHIPCVCASENGDRIYTMIASLMDNRTMSVLYSYDMESDEWSTVNEISGVYGARSSCAALRRNDDNNGTTSIIDDIYFFSGLSSRNSSGGSDSENDEENIVKITPIILVMDSDFGRPHLFNDGMLIPRLDSRAQIMNDSEGRLSVLVSGGRVSEYGEWSLMSSEVFELQNESLVGFGPTLSQPLIGHSLVYVNPPSSNSDSTVERQLFAIGGANWWTDSVPLFSYLNISDLSLVSDAQSKCDWCEGGITELNQFQSLQEVYEKMHVVIDPRFQTQSEFDGELLFNFTNMPSMLIDQPYYMWLDMDGVHVSLVFLNASQIEIEENGRFLGMVPVMDSFSNGSSLEVIFEQMNVMVESLDDEEQVLLFEMDYHDFFEDYFGEDREVEVEGLELTVLLDGVYVDSLDEQGGNVIRVVTDGHSMKYVDILRSTFIGTFETIVIEDETDSVDVYIRDVRAAKNLGEYGFLVVDHASDVEIMDVMCQNSTETEEIGCMLIENVDRTTDILRVTCSDINAEVGCLEVEDSGTVYIESVECKNMRSETIDCVSVTDSPIVEIWETSCFDGSNGCIYMEENEQVLISDTKCTRNDGIEHSTCIYDYASGNLTVESVDCASNTGANSSTACVEVLSEDWVKIHNVHCMDHSGDCVSVWNVWSVLLNHTHCERTRNGIAGCGNIQSIRGSTMVMNSVCHSNQNLMDPPMMGCFSLWNTINERVENIECFEVSATRTGSSCLSIWTRSANEVIARVSDITCYDSIINGGCLAIRPYSGTNTATMVTDVSVTNSFAVVQSIVRCEVDLGYFQGLNISFNNGSTFGTAFSSANSRNVTLLDSHFYTNRATQAGGAIYFSSSTVDLIGLIAVDNRAVALGGAVFYNGQTTVVCDGCYFDSNYADYGGAFGVLAESEDSFTILRDTWFIGNLATSSGAGYFNFMGSFIFENVTCENNAAKSGGACMYDDDGYAECSGQTRVSEMRNSRFIDNSAQVASAVYLHGCQRHLINNYFRGNHATFGGGAMLLDTVDGDHVIEQCVFETNRAGSSGGAVGITGGRVTVKECTFVDNLVPDGLGGGLSILEDARFGLEVTMTMNNFTGNQASGGGGLAIVSTDDEESFTLENDIKLVTIENSTFYRNNATVIGGGIFVEVGNADLYSNLFLQNTAQYRGGGLALGNGSISDFNSRFEGNTAIRGGGVYFLSAKVSLNDTEFVSNEASYGAGLFLAQCPLTDASDLLFESNEASITGGAIFTESSECSNWCSDEECEFVDNTAPYGAQESSGPVSIKVTTKPKRLSGINQNDKVLITVELLDHYDQIVKSTGSDLIAEATIVTDDIIGRISLKGTTEDKFHEGIAVLSLQLDPVRNVQQSDTTLDLNVTISEPTNGLSETLSLSFTSEVYDVQSWNYGTLSAFSAIGIAATIGTALMFWEWRKVPVFKGATPPFLWIILLGCLLLAITIAVIPWMPYTVDCVGLVWFLHLSFVLIFFPLMGKTWRIYMIFLTAKTKFSKFTMSTERLAVYFIAIPMGLVFIWCLIWTLVSNQWTDWEIASDGANREFCSLSGGFLATSMVSAAIVISYMVYLANGVKDVPRNFNEAFWLGATTYSLGLITLFMLLLSIAPAVSAEAKQLLGGIGCWIALLSVLGFIYWRKLYLLYTHPEMRLTKKEQFEQNRQKRNKNSDTATSQLTSSNASSFNSNTRS